MNPLTNRNNHEVLLPEQSASLMEPSFARAIVRPCRVALLLVFLAIRAGFGQGTIIFQNTPTTLVYTNMIGYGGNRGPTAPTPDAFYYGLFIAPSTVTTVALPDLLSGPWNFTGLYATNTTLPGRFSGASDAAAPGWAPGQTNAFAVVGWSSTLGPTWAELSGRFQGPVLQNNSWTGVAPSGLGVDYLGLSGVGVGAAGGGQFTSFPIFGPPNQQGVPLSSGFDLYHVFVPEPGSLSLLTTGFVLMRLRRRRMWIGRV